MYTALADVYDLFADDDAAARADYYARFLPDGGEGVDIGCGTGTLTLALYARGFRVYGVDSSPEMLRRAGARALETGADLRFMQGDAACVPYAHPLDFAVAANDVFNYVKPCLPAFRNVCAALKKGGVFAFDISSAYKLEQVLAGNTFSQTKDDVTYVWQNFRSGKKLIIDFTVFSPQGSSYIKTYETQTQYIYTQEEITAALKAAGFTRVRAYAFGKTSKPLQKTERIAFVAIK